MKEKKTAINLLVRSMDFFHAAAAADIVGSLMI